MKIILFSKMFPRPWNDNFGSYVYEQIQELEKLDTQIEIISPRIYLPKITKVLGGKFKKYASAPNEYLYKGLKIKSPPCLWIKELGNSIPEIKYLFFKLSIKNYLVKTCRNFKPDIIYSLDPVIDGRLAVEVGQLLHIPVILIEHSVPENYRNLVNNKKAINIYSKVVHKASHTIFVSSSQKRRFENLIGESIKGSIVYNGYRNELSNVSKSVSKNIFEIISIGFLEDRKGFPTLLKSVEQLMSRTKLKIHLTIVGDGYYRKKYEDTVSQSGISDIVDFVGIVSHQEVYNLLYKSNLFVLPSYDESFGIAYLEAMSCKVPIVGTIGEGISDIVKNGHNGFLIEKENDKQLSDVILYAMNHPEEMNSMAQIAYKTVSELTWEKNANNIFNVFNTVIRGFYE